MNSKKEGLHFKCSYFYFTLLNSNPSAFPVIQIISMGSRRAFCSLPRSPIVVFIFSKPLSTKIKTTQCCLFFCKTVFKKSYTKHSLLANEQFLKNSTLQNYSKDYQLFHLQQESSQILEKGY